MIPWLTGKAILTWVLDHSGQILAGFAIFIALWSLYAWGYNRSTKYWKPQVQALQTTLNNEREQHKQASDKANAEREQQQADAKALVEQVRSHYENRVHANNAVADDLRSELRRTRAGVRPLAPAAAAPTACRDYESDRTRLPPADQDFLVDFARRCEAVANSFNTCREYALGLHRICSAAPQ